MSESKDVNLDRIQNAIDQLSEFFDSIQIFCSKYEGSQDGVTVSYSRGTGNWYARRGHVQEWLIKENEAVKEDIRKSMNDE